MRAVWIVVLVATVGCSRDAPPTPEASRPKPTIRDGIGTEHPVIVEAASAAGSWVAYCQARRDTDGDGRIEILIDWHHGTVFGDEMVPYVSLASGQEEPIDAFVGAHPSGLYLAFVQQGRLWVVDARTDERKRYDLTKLGARSADDGNASMSHPAVAFDPVAERVAFVHQAVGAHAVGLMDLTTGTSRLIYTSQQRIWRVHFDGDRVIAYVMDTDTDGNGVVQAPSIDTDLAARRCRGAPAAAMTMGMSGDEPTHVPIDVGRARFVDPERRVHTASCSADGRRYLAAFAGGQRLAASWRARLDVNFGPLSWVNDARDVPCPKREPREGGPFAEVMEIPYTAAAWAERPDRVWVERRWFDLRAGNDPHLDTSRFANDQGMSGVGHSDVWAVKGFFGEASHWNGSVWQEHESPLLRKAVGVVAAPESRAWVYREDGAVVGWDGRLWHELPRASETRITDAQLVGEQLWVATVSGQVLHLDDGAWRATDGLPGASILSIQLPSSAIGFATTGEGEVWTWDGTRWAHFARLVPRERRFAEYLFDVRATAPNDVWVSSSVGRLFHWDGTAWTTYDSGNDLWELREILGVWDEEVLLREDSAIVRFRRDR